MKPPRGLSAGEQAAWARLAQSVTPLAGRSAPPVPANSDKPKTPAKPVSPPRAQPAAPAKSPPFHPPASLPPPPRPTTLRTSAPGLRPTTPSFSPAHQPVQGLDSHWERRIKGGRLEPDLTLDLHGHTLDSAYDRINAGLEQARQMGARVMLVIAGRERPIDPADRQTKRGAIRAKLLDWLAASPHADAVAAVRRAHRSHGGDGALYVVLRRGR